MSVAAVDDVPGRLEQVRRTIARSCADARRDPAEVNLVCVSKTFEAEDILPALRSGQRIFGENRVQEAASKWPALRAAFPDVELHLIGPLQSNKAELAVDVFDKIQTIDRVKIASAIAEHSRKKNTNIPCFIQVNTGAESQKAGVSVEDLPGLLNACRHDLGLTIEGLMCIPPVDRPVSPHFALLYRLARDLGVEKLSMGMSADFEQAIQLGATHVRVGSAIFGAR
ncbi:pyridoxal phosphate enzyme (YggS family) [Rhodoblastus acidophilus]|uniref:YggS family pyridoxal phosphate-dependent enzyme n=1 Tax=Rhodoblastus acidophilus TaxID=1074 RepID=UPI00222655C3|nr:YggS family pyridoxal phosphate-dependent enzyme [Rhodoblastus acidophilus]MCW2333020.1 pyridoxal phosphate enzyme (YggS family) [Rhodoblastus acidophilus]